jgi:hypothetical protein
MSSAVDPLGLTYWHLKKESTEMDWHQIGAQAANFTDAFDEVLNQDKNEDPDVRKYYEDRIDAIATSLHAELVTAKDDPLLMIKRTDFTFVYCSLFKNGLHTGCWMAVPYDTSKNPKLMCCFFHQARTQKKSEWQVPAGEVDKLVDCDKDFNLN